MTTVHQADLCAKHIGERIKGTTGTLDFEGMLQSVHHEVETQVLAMSSSRPVRISTRTTVTVSGQEFLLARDSHVVIP